MKWLLVFCLALPFTWTLPVKVNTWKRNKIYSKGKKFVPFRYPSHHPFRSTGFEITLAKHDAMDILGNNIDTMKKTPDADSAKSDLAKSSLVANVIGAAIDSQKDSSVNEKEKSGERNDKSNEQPCPGECLSQVDLGLCPSICPGGIMGVCCNEKRSSPTLNLRDVVENKIESKDAGKNDETTI